MECIICRSEKVDPVFCLKSAPKYTQKVFAKPNPVMSKRVDVTLLKCNSCGMVQINPETLLQDDGYWMDYLNSRACSRLYVEYDRTLADNFVKRFKLENKNIIEVGPGDGYFSEELRKRGAIMTCVEPSKKASDIVVSKGIRCFNCFLDENFPVKVKEKFDGFVCKQVIDLVSSPNALLKNLGAVLKVGAYGLIDVPSWTKTLLDRRYYAILPDRIGYYTAQTLTNLLELNGFHVLEIFHGAEDEYVGAYVYYEKNKDNLLNSFKEEFAESKEVFLSLIKKCRDKNKNIAAWGAGAKGITIFSVAGMDSGIIKYVIDKDCNRWGCYMSGSLLRIVSPDFLKKDPVDVMIITAAMFYKEIIRDLIMEYNFKGDIILLSPMPHIVKRREIEGILAEE